MPASFSTSTFDRLAGELNHADHSASELLSNTCIGYFQDTLVAIWANNPRHMAGTIGRELGDELDDFFDLISTSDPKVIILCLDSAGVDLNQARDGMYAVARAIKRMHHFNSLPGRLSIAFIGDERGCFGGALMLAGACQYRYANPEAAVGVSGCKLIARVTGTAAEDFKHLYTTDHRISTGEIDGLYDPGSKGIADFMQLPPRQLTREGLRERLSTLGQRLHNEDHFNACNQVTGTSWGGFADPHPLTLTELYSAARWLLDYPEANARLALKGNAVQAFSFSNEQLGFSTFLALLSATLCLLSEQGVHISITADQQGSGATFIAFTMMADQLLLTPEARVEALPQKAVAALSTEFHSQW